MTKASTAVVMVTDCDHPSIDIEQTALHDVCPKILWKNCKTEEALIAECKDAEALLVQYAPITRRVIEALTRCKVLVRYGVGVDSIDLNAAKEHGIIVSNVPDYGTHEVSDQALAMMLALTRKVAPASAYVKQGQWDFRLMSPIRRMQVQTLGLVGLGRIGLAMAHKSHAIGMKIIAADPAYANSAGKLPDYITIKSLDEVLKESDVVSIHCPLSDATRNLIDEAKLRLMKPTAYLVNTARGSIVNEEALDKVLSEKKIAGAAMDVLSQEPAPASHPLFKHDNFLCTPHMAWHSEESAQELKRKVAEEARRVLRGEAPFYQVN